jgi:hypothetical protein
LKQDLTRVVDHGGNDRDLGGDKRVQLIVLTHALGGLEKAGGELFNAGPAMTTSCIFIVSPPVGCRCAALIQASAHSGIGINMIRIKDFVRQSSFQSLQWLWTRYSGCGYRIIHCRFQAGQAPYPAGA